MNRPTSIYLAEISEWSAADGTHHWEGYVCKKDSTRGAGDYQTSHSQPISCCCCNETVMSATQKSHVPDMEQTPFSIETSPVPTAGRMLD